MPDIGKADEVSEIADLEFAAEDQPTANSSGLKMVSTLCIKGLSVKSISARAGKLWRLF